MSNENQVIQKNLVKKGNLFGRFFSFFPRNFFEKQLPNPLEIEISSCLDQELLFSWIIFTQHF